MGLFIMMKILTHN